MKLKKKTKSTAKRTWGVLVAGLAMTGVAVGATLEQMPLFGAGTIEMIELVKGSTADSHPYSLSTEEVEAIFTRRLKGRGRKQVSKLARHFVDLCQLHHFDPAFLLSLIEKESGFRTYATSKVGATGLMQVMPVTAGYIAERAGIVTYRHPGDLRDPFVNLTLGVAYLAYLRDQFPHAQRFLAAYNLGPTTVRRMVRRGTFKLGKVRRYVTGIESGEELMRQEAKKLGLELAGFVY